MRIFKVQSEFSVLSTTENILIDNHYKLFTDQSEVNALPAGCIARQNKDSMSCLDTFLISRYMIHRKTKRKENSSSISVTNPEINSGG